MAHALETNPRVPVIWMHGLECTCCSESFIRSAHPLVKDVVLSMISLDYDDTIMAAAGHQAEEILAETKEKYKGKYILAVEGNPPLNEGGMFCIDGGKPFVEKLKWMAEDAIGDHRLGRLRVMGLRAGGQAQSDPGDADRQGHPDKPIIKVPGCPPIAEVMTGVVTFITTFGRLPELDRQGRPKMFYSQRIHDKCYRRPHFDAGQFVEEWDDENARKGYCLYKMGCKGPTTYNACSTVRWNGGVSFPIQSGHGCIGCSEDGFWDKGPFYERLTNIKQFGIEHNADEVGLAAVGVVGAGVAAHAAVTAVKRIATQARPTPIATLDHSVRETQSWASQTPNGFNLDNSGKRIVVDPVTRIEGHMRVEVNVDKDNVIRNAVSTGTMWRGIEVILRGRDPRDAWAFTAADLRRLHRHPCADLGARGRKRARHHDPGERQFDPQHHAADAAGA